MKIKDGRITLLAETGSMGGAAEVRIELRDADASIIFAEIKLTPEQWVAVMSRQGYVECDIEISELNKIGKKMIHKKFEFPLGENIDFMKERMIAKELIKEVCPEGWEASAYFRSQDSFFKKDGHRWARTTIRKWE